MRVAVLGAGAMGSLFGGRLHAAGHEVTLLRRTEPHVAAVERDGLRIGEMDGDATVVHPRATTDPASVGEVDLLVVFVKSYDTREAMDDAGPILDGEPEVLTLQNGLGNAETIAEFVPEERVLAGTTAQAAVFEEPGRVRHAGAGHTVLGRYFDRGDAAAADAGRGTPTADAELADPVVERVAGALADAGIDCEVAGAGEPVRAAVWEKVLVNVGINAATALARVRNGLLAETEPGLALVDGAVSEALDVAQAAGAPVPEDAVASTLAVAEATAANESSMRQDLAAGRRTEIDDLNGAIVERAERHDLDAPVNRTLTRLVRLAEAGAVGDP